jgi:hypothetical protein
MSTMRTRSRLALVIFTAVLVTVAGGRLPAHAASGLTPVATLPLRAVAHEVALDGDFAYVATSRGLAIVDVANPAAPVARGSLRVGRILGVAVKGTHVFLGGPSVDLRVVDASSVDAPVIVAKLRLPGYVWDVALKGNTLYVASFSGEIYLFDVTDPTHPAALGTLGVRTWNTPGDQAAALAALDAGTDNGNAKVTSVSVAGDLLLSVDFNYGRVYAWDITDPMHPVFKGTHAVPYTLRVQGDAAHGEIYALSAFGRFSGVSSVATSLLDPHVSTSAATCASCGHLATPATDYGGLAVSPSGKYVVFVAGKRGIIDVVDVSNPSAMADAGSLSIGRFGAKLAENLGVTIRGDHIFVGAGILGLQVFSFPGLSE